MAVSVERSYPGKLVKAGREAGKVRTAVSGWVNGFLHGAPRNTAAADFLPWDVNYRLSVTDELKPAELLSLVGSHVDATFYLTAKALDADPEGQRALLEHGVDQHLRQPSNPPGLKPILNDTINRMSKDATVKGAKLKQMNRQGFDHWESLYRNAAFEMRNNGVSPVILAYAPLEGLGQFVNAFQNTGKPLHILIDTWIRPNEEGQEKGYCGYRVNFDAPFGERVQHIGPDFERPENTVIFDDTRRTGRHLQEAWQFISGSTTPIPDSRWKVIDNVPGVII